MIHLLFQNVNQRVASCFGKTVLGNRNDQTGNGRKMIAGAEN
jgi:hypothetical protein